jgi:hypothetical protein
LRLLRKVEIREGRLRRILNSLTYPSGGLEHVAVLPQVRFASARVSSCDLKCFLQPYELHSNR